MQLHKIVFFVGCFAVLFGCNSSTKKNPFKAKGYLITGLNYSTADSIFLLNNDKEVVNKAKIKQEISLKGKVKSPEMAYIKLNNSAELYPLLLENEDFSVFTSKSYTSIGGGKLNKKLFDYQEQKRKNAVLKSNFYDEFSVKKITLRNYLNSVDSLRKLDKQNYLSFIKDNQDNLLSLFLIKQQELSSKEIKEATNLVANSNNSQLKSYLSNLYTETIKKEAIARIENRKLAPEFSGTNLEGRTTSLAQVKRGKKAVLIDFWASWCGPCRMVSPRVKRIYNQYKNKGFDIVTVSQDRSINAWEVGVYDDGMEEWHHVYDEDGYIAKNYGVRRIPHMVLLDDKGRIIKNKISLTNLEKELEKIFN